MVSEVEHPTPAEQTANARTAKVTAKHVEVHKRLQRAAVKRRAEAQAHGEAVARQNANEQAQIKRDDEAAEHLPPTAEEREAQAGTSTVGVEQYDATARSAIEHACEGGDSAATCRCFLVQLEMHESQNEALHGVHESGDLGKLSRLIATEALKNCRRR